MVSEQRKLLPVLICVDIVADEKRPHIILCFYEYLGGAPLNPILRRRQGFNRQPELNTNGVDGQQRVNGGQASSPTTYSPTMSGLTPSTSFSSTTGQSLDNLSSPPEAQTTIEQPKFFFREKFAKLGVKGNFMPLAAQPVNVDIADWLAHQSNKSCA